MNTIRTLIGSDVKSLVLIYVETQLAQTGLLDWVPFKIFTEKISLNLTIREE